ncbi:cell division control protein Cdc6 [Haloquadratum walsbyi]|uniref:cell division control protein Cdc6 n=1 Tax=Haloquadratum walsbyi TaxID=293091 RepID=UPI0026E96A30|nr:cell division control protein Cdc6 [Haloquadratum walsbyi]
MFEQLEDETSTRAIYINCRQYNIRSSLLTELLIEIGYPALRKGRPVDGILSRLQEFIRKNRSGVAIALDELDCLGDQTEVVYNLEMLSSSIEKDIGLMMVPNRDPRQLWSDLRSESRLDCSILCFDPYSEAEFVDIFNQRVTQAFRPGVVEDGIVEVIAEQVAPDSGDCREARVGC